MKAFLFGAGSSYGTLGSLAPVAGGFGGELAKLSGWPKDFQKLRKVVNHLGGNAAGLGLEPIWTCIDYYDKLRGALPDKDWSNPSNRGSGVRELKRALLMIYGSRCDQKADTLPLSESYTLGKLLKNVEPGDALISFNYDTVVERLSTRLGSSIRMYCDEFRGDVVNLVKPHGSTTWTMNLNDGSVRWKESGGIIMDSMDESEIEQKREPLLLGAVPIKSELIQEVQKFYGCPDIFHVVMKQWRAAIEAVQKADLLVVVGYSFPREDQYGRFLFSEARRSSPLKVDFYEMRNRVSERADCILSAFPHLDVRLEWKGPVEGPKP